MVFKKKTLLILFCTMLLVTMFTPFSYAQQDVDVAGIGFNIPEHGYVFLSFDNYFTAIVTGEGNPYYDYFFKGGTQSLKYDISFIKDSLERHVNFEDYFNSALQLGGGSFSEIMNNVPKDKLLDETFLIQVKEAKAIDGELVFAPYIEPTEPTAKLTIIPDPILKDGFNLANVKANILGVENADKYAIKYSVKDVNGDTHYVTTQKAKSNDINPDLIQYIEGETGLEVLIYDANNKLIVVENLKVEIN